MLERQSGDTVAPVLSLVSLSASLSCDLVAELAEKRPPDTDENGKRLRDGERSDFFQVWSDGKEFRWISFATISAIETRVPRNGKGP